MDIGHWFLDVQPLGSGSRLMNVLAMDNTTNNKPAKGKKTKGNGTRKFWTRTEEEALIESVKELIMEGWQSGNGWKPDFNGQVAIRIQHKVPGSDVLGDPHVISKMASWRKDYGALSRLFGRTGSNFVGLDPLKHTITIVGSEVWEAGIVVNPDLLKMQNKSYPHYNDWDIIFGFSKGTGDHAVDGSAARERANNMPPMPDAPPHVGQSTGVEDITSQAGESSSAPQNSGGPGPWKPSGIKKRKNRTPGMEDEVMLKIIGSLERTDVAINDLSSAIRSLKDVDPQVTLIYAAIQDLSEFTMTTMVRAAKIIVQSPTHVALFFSMDQENRKEFVRSILAE